MGVVRIMISENKQNVTCFAGCVLSVFALNMNLDVLEGENWLLLFLKSLESIEIFDLILFPLLYGFYRHVLENCGKVKASCAVPAALFAFFMVMGYSFYRQNSWELVMGSRLQFLKSVTAFLGWFFIFYFSISWLFYQMDRIKIGYRKKERTNRLLSRYFASLRKHPFGTCFLTLFLAYLPYMILSWPGILTTDSRRQLIEGYGFLVSGSRLKNHHPVVHTLFLSASLAAGEGLFHSANAGIFFYCCIQAMLMFAAISWLIRLLAELEFSDKYLVLTMLFFILAPRNQNYLFLAVKDVCFASFLMIWLTQLFRLATGTFGGAREKTKHMILFGCASAGVFFMRQDGVYLLLITFFAAAALQPENRKRWMRFGIGTVVFFLLYQSVILPGLGISRSSRREMLSVPFQQTARYVRDAGDEVTEEEKEAISAVLDYEHLAELYNPNLSDPVKGTFREEATGEEMRAYFKVWSEMLFKHPDIYVQATMNNLYGYFYPNGYTANLYDYGKSSEQMEKLNEALSEEYGLYVSYPEALESARNGYEALREAVFKLPVLSAFLNPACYVWTLLLWFFWCIRKKDKPALLTTIPLMSFLLVCMAGPAYGWYFRYLYSLAVCLPAVIHPGLYRTKTAEKKVCS